MDFREGVPKEERNPLRVVRVYRKLCKPAECSDKKKTIKKKKTEENAQDGNSGLCQDVNGKWSICLCSSHSWKSRRATICRYASAEVMLHALTI